jgi:hypothetical protein
LEAKCIVGGGGGDHGAAGHDLFVDGHNSANWTVSFLKYFMLVK